MNRLQKPIATLLMFSLFLYTTNIRAESVDDQFAQISPALTPGTGEFVHGQGHGKLLIRILVVGSVSMQGIHYVPEGTDIIFAILYAGGYTDTSKLSAITIRRRGMKSHIDVDLEGLIKDGKPIPKLSDGDVVTVPFNWKQDFNTIAMITGLVSSITALSLSILALVRRP